MAHARLLRPCQFKESVQHRHHQLMSMTQRNSRLRCILGRTTGQAERHKDVAVDHPCRQPQVMGVFEHRQRFAAVQRQGKFGRQVMETRLVLQGAENLRGQWPTVEQLLRVDACRRAEHQVAHIVACRVTRPQTSVQ